MRMDVITNHKVNWKSLSYYIFWGGDGDFVVDDDGETAVIMHTKIHNLSHNGNDWKGQLKTVHEKHILVEE